jgi:hypothetical protein
MRENTGKFNDCTYRRARTLPVDHVITVTMENHSSTLIRECDAAAESSGIAQDNID